MIPVPVATNYAVRATGEFALEFKCALCKTKARASVHAESIGHTVGGPLGLGGSKKTSSARSAAVAGLSDAAIDLLDLAKCSACHKRNPSAVRIWWIGHSIPVFLVALWITFFEWGMLVELSVIAACVLWLCVSFAQRLRHVDNRVTFQAMPPAAYVVAEARSRSDKPESSSGSCGRVA